MSWAWNSVGTSIELKDFVALWNQRGKLLSGEFDRKQEVLGILSFDRFGARGNGLKDDTKAIQATFSELRDMGGGVAWGTGGKTYKTTETIYQPSWTTLFGAGYMAPGRSFNGVTTILGAHTGAAVLSRKGAFGCGLSNILLQTQSSAIPKTGLCDGRDSAGSAGSHWVQNLNISGYFSQSAAYFCASEENDYNNINIYLQGGGALYGLTEVQGDSLSVDSMTGSSNIHNTFKNLRISSEVVDDLAACINVEAGAGTGDLCFHKAYLLPCRGSYVRVNVGSQDGAGNTRKIFFDRCSGEINTTSTGPLYGFDLQSTAALQMKISIDGSTMPCRAGGNFLRQGANLTIADSHIEVPVPDRAPSYIKSQILRSDINFGAGREIYDNTMLTGNMGFYGTTPIARQLLATGAAHTVDDVITALQALGLVRQV